MACKCSTPVCLRLRRRMYPISLLLISLLLMSVFFFGWHLDEPDCAILQGPLDQLLWVENLLGFANTTIHHTSFVFWIITTIAFTVTFLSTVVAYPRSLHPLLFVPGIVALWPVYNAATRTELFLYVLPLHFSINASFVMIMDEPRTSDLFEDVEPREKDGAGAEEGLLSPGSR